MPTLPGPNEAATIALGIVDELIDRLVAKGVLTSQERHSIWADVAARLSDHVTKLRQDSATILRERIKDQE